MKCVLVLAGGAAWESAALAALGRSREFVVLKRCVDVADLMGAATTGQADLAVVALEVPGLDVIASDHLRRHRVLTVGIDSTEHTVEPSARDRRIDVSMRLRSEEIGRLVEVLAAHAEQSPARSGEVADRDPGSDPAKVGAPPLGQVIACWGPYGAPGRTTVAIGIAAELARRQVGTILVDADPWGGAVAQQLGVLDEVSGLLASARLSANGELAARFASVQRGLGEHLQVITGLPRADRWIEVRPGTVEHLCDLGRRTSQLVVDTGFSIEDDSHRDLGSRPSRNSMTLAALTAADQIVVVGGADPVGLARLARGLTELGELALGKPVQVVVNRMRPTLGWSEKEILGMVSGFGRARGTGVVGIHVLPEDRRGVDAALVSGALVMEGPLANAMIALVDALAPASIVATKRRGLRRRTAGTARLR